MPDTNACVRSEVHGRVLKIIIDNVAKKNAFVPVMMEQLSDALTELDSNSEFWVGVLCAEGDHFTAGLDMPKFFGPGAEKRERKEGNVDPFGLSKRCTKPIVTAVQGITFTVGIEMMMAGDIAIAASARWRPSAGLRHWVARTCVLSKGQGGAMPCTTCCYVTSLVRTKRIGLGLCRRLCPMGRRLSGLWKWRS